MNPISLSLSTKADIFEHYLPMLTSVITGDIINSSSSSEPQEWLAALRRALGELGKEPETWEIFRGDSFQAEVQDIGRALLFAIRIKATIKCIKGLDVRIAIGLGEKSYASPRITEANGPAFVHSGQLFERLKKQNLAIKTPWPDVDSQINLLLSLALLTMDNWTPNSAEAMKMAIDMPGATQMELAKKMKLSQASISERLSRAGYEEIMQMDRRYRELVQDKTGTA